MSDYVTDTKSVLDQALRVLQAMVDVAADGGWLETTVGAMRLAQMVTQGRWLDAPGLDDLPHMDEAAVRALSARGVVSLKQLLETAPDALRSMLPRGFKDRKLAELNAVLRTLPRVRLSAEAPAGALHPGGEGAVVVHLEALHAASRSKAFAPRFPKPKLAGWWLVMGEEGVELVALKRVRFDRAACRRSCSSPRPTSSASTWKVMLISDSTLASTRSRSASRCCQRDR